MLPKNLYTVIIKQPKQIIETDYLKLIISKKPNVFGYAVQDGEGLSIGREEGTPELDDLETMNTETVDFRSMMCFGWLDKGFNIEDIQPFTINDADNNPFLAIGLDGDFPKYDTNNGRTQEFNLMSEIIAPTLADICELTDGEITKLMAALGKPSFNNNFLAALGHRGVLNILPFEGDPFFAGKDTLGGEPFTWGRTSNLHGWGDVKQEPVKVEEKKSRFSFGKKVAPVQDAATPGTAPRASVPEVNKTGATTVVDVKKEEKATGPLPIRPPEWLHNNDDKRAWYQMVAGTLPTGWKKRIPVIPVEGAKIPATVVDLQNWVVDRKKASIAASTTKPEPAKTETSTGAPKTGAEIKAIRQEENLPIIPAKDMEKVLDFVAKHLDGQSVQMQDPATIQALETKHGDFSAAVGCTPQESINWPVSGLFGLANTDPRSIVLYALEMRVYARKYMEEKGMLKTPTSTTTETKIGDTGKKVESIANEPAVQPKVEKKKFSFGKKVA